MNTKHTEIENFKSDIKLIAEYTKEYNKVFKDAQRSDPYYPQNANALVAFVNKWEATQKIPQVVSVWDKTYVRRHMHVAYALLKGRSIDQIEQRSNEDLNMNLVKSFIESYTGSKELADSFDAATGKINRDLMYSVEVV
jgi:hypothetical protein